MHGRACYALISLLLLTVYPRAETTCVDAALLAHSTVSITRYFDDAERAAHAGLISIQGTGWFAVSDHHCHHRARCHSNGAFDPRLELVDFNDGVGRQSSFCPYPALDRRRL